MRVKVENVQSSGIFEYTFETTKLDSRRVLISYERILSKN